MHDPPPATVVDALGWATEQLDAGGVPGPRREALDMWSVVTAVDPVVALARPSASVPQAQWQHFKAAVDRRVEGEPLAYAVGRASFRTLELKVNRSVLIPRPETEGLVQAVLDWSQGRSRAGTVADIGTGSGCIALSLAAEGAFDRIIATDVSEEAVSIATGNMALLRLTRNVEFRLGDLLSPLRLEVFDVIVSNPPYVTAEEFARLDPAVRDFEPRAALVSGQKGMWHTSQLLQRAGSHLTPGGLVALEIDARRARDALHLAVQAGWDSPHIERDVFGRDRYLLARNPLTRTPGRSAR